MEKSIKSVIMKVTFVSKPNIPLEDRLFDLEGTLKYLRKLPIEIDFEHTDTQSGLNIDFEDKHVSIYPEKISARYIGLENIKDCAITYENSHIVIVNRVVKGITHCNLYTKPKE